MKKVYGKRKMARLAAGVCLGCAGWLMPLAGPGFAATATADAAAVSEAVAPVAYTLGRLYEHGYGVTQDSAAAAEWYARAAATGYVPSDY